MYVISNNIYWFTYRRYSLAIPEVRQAVATKANQWKESVEKKIKKDKKEKFEVLK